MTGSTSKKPVWVCLGCAGLACASACEQWFGIPGGEFTVRDADGATYGVRGTAVGVLAPLDLRLDYPGGSDRARVTGDGSFTFEVRLADGVAYEIVPVGDAPCVVANGRGVVSARDVEIELACQPVLLTDLTISGAAAPDLAFDPARREYDVDVSLLQQGVRVTATAASAEASVEIASHRVESGAPSPRVPLALGENTIEITVRHVSGAERAHRLVIRRAAGVAQHAYGKPTNTGAGDGFGASVAVWGDTMAVGAPGEDSPATGVDGNQGNHEDFLDSGAVYVFRRTGGAWTQEAYLKASNTAAASQFGVSVALWGDTLAVGAWGEQSARPGDDGPVRDSGAVYVFRRAGSAWAQEAFLKASNAGESDEFGWSVALWEDALAVGAPQESSSSRGIDGNQEDDSAPGSGAVYVYRRNGSGWEQEAYIKASNAERADQFGISVALWNRVLAVGAYLEDSAATGVNGDQHEDTELGDSGAAYVFRYTDGAWAQDAYLKASNSDDGDNFGYRVALWADALAVNAVYEDSAATGVNQDAFNEENDNSGAAYVFRYADGAWAEEAYLKASDSAQGDKFSDSLALCGDTLVAGTFFRDGESGAAYVFQRADGVWREQARLQASNRGGGDWFAYNLALSEDTLAIGAVREDSQSTGVDGDGGNDGAGNSGAVYVFH